MSTQADTIFVEDIKRLGFVQQKQHSNELQSDMQFYYVLQLDKYEFKLRLLYDSINAKWTLDYLSSSIDDVKTIVTIKDIFEYSLELSLNFGRQQQNTEINKLLQTKYL